MYIHMYVVIVTDRQTEAVSGSVSSSSISIYISIVNNAYKIIQATALYGTNWYSHACMI